MSQPSFILLAQRAAAQPALIASLIAPHLDRTRQTLDEMAAAEDLTPIHLARLALCRRPREDRFAADVARIAAYVGMDATRLRRLYRQLQAEERIRGGTGTAPWLMAARDSDPDDET